MTKLILPERRRKGVILERLEIDLELEDLVLFRTGLHNETDAKLGLFEGESLSWDHKTVLRFKNSYLISPNKKIQAGIFCMLGKIFYQPISIAEIYIGQEKVVRALQSWQGYDEHADWVAKLKKPYL